MYENEVRLLGNLVADPEVRATAGANPMSVATFRVAINRPKRNGEDRGADYITCKAWGKTADVVEKWLHKGSKVGIGGRWTTGSYKNRDGQTVYTNECTVEEIKFFSEPQQERPRQEEAHYDGFAQLNEDVPF